MHVAAACGTLTITYLSHCARQLGDSIELTQLLHCIDVCLACAFDVVKIALLWKKSKKDCARRTSRVWVCITSEGDTGQRLPLGSQAGTFLRSYRIDRPRLFYTFIVLPTAKLRGKIGDGITRNRYFLLYFIHLVHQQPANNHMSMMSRNNHNQQCSNFLPLDSIASRL